MGSEGQRLCISVLRRPQDFACRRRRRPRAEALVAAQASARRAAQWLRAARDKWSLGLGWVKTTQKQLRRRVLCCQFRELRLAALRRIGQQFESCNGPSRRGRGTRSGAHPRAANQEGTKQEPHTKPSQQWNMDPNYGESSGVRRRQRTSGKYEGVLPGRWRGAGLQRAPLAKPGAKGPRQHGDGAPCSHQGAARRRTSQTKEFQQT